MWGKKKLSKPEPDPEKEIDDLFKHMEGWREIVLTSHGTVILIGNGTKTPGWDPKGEDLEDFRKLLELTINSPGSPPPPIGNNHFIGDYKGFFLADPFEDRKDLSLEDIPDFASPRPFSDIYTLFRGTLRLHHTQKYYYAQELEDWVQEKWLLNKGPLRPDC